MATLYEDSLKEIVDVQELQPCRGSRRGQITLIEHYFETKTLLNHINTTELTRK